MRIRLFSLLVCMIVGAWVSVEAQTFKELWGNVKGMEEKGLPQSAIEIAGRIFEKAVREKNSPQMLKAYLTRANLRDEMSPDSFSISLKGMLEWEETTVDPVEKAILNSVIARAYADYMPFSMDGSGRKQVDLKGYVPDNMDEWTENLFVEKTFQHLRRSLKERELLQKKSSLAYEPFVTKGRTSAYHGHNLYSLLAGEAIQTLSRLPQPFQEAERAFHPSAEPGEEKIFPIGGQDVVAEVMRIYQSLFPYYISRQQGDALVLSLLDYYKYAFLHLNAGGDESGKPDSCYAHILTGMIEKYGKYPACAEVYGELADVYSRSGNLAKAYDTLKKAISRYPAYERINMLRNAMDRIDSPVLNMSWGQSVYPGKKFDLKVNYANLKGMAVRFYRIKKSVSVYDLENGDYGHPDFLKRKTRLVSENNFALKDHKDYAVRDTVISVAPPAEGWYLVSADPEGKKGLSQPQLMYVTKLRAITRTAGPENKTDLVVVDNETGHPLSGVNVYLYNGKNQVVKTLVTNVSGGIPPFSSEEINSYSLKKGDDKGMGIRRIFAHPNRDAGKQSGSYLMLFTDRGIYRPGQTVFVKGVAYDLSFINSKAVVGRDYTLGLYDANGNLLSDAKVRTDEFGAFSTRFILPSRVLNGIFSLRCEGIWENFRVEEYKRPSFDISLQRQTETYGLGDSVRVHGNVSTFSGVPLAGAKAVYTVWRKPALWWRMFPEKEKLLATGSINADSKGNFDFGILLKPGNRAKKEDVYYNYTAEVSVTGSSGETQSGEIAISAGSKSALLSIGIPGNICREKLPEIKCSAINLDGDKLALKGEYMLRRQAGGAASELKGPFVSGTAINLSGWEKLPSGKYTLAFVSRDTQGRKITTEKEFVLYSEEDEAPPVKTSDWFVQVDTAFAPGKPAVLLFGSCEKDIYAFLDIYRDSGDFETKIIRLSNSVKKITIPYSEQNKNKTASVQITFVKHGKSYSHSAQISLPIPPKELNMSWKVFRDKLKPGQRESWTLSIRKPDGSPADANLLASMYDASLDKVSPFYWNRKIYYNRPYFRLYRDVEKIWDVTSYTNFKATYPEYPPLQYDRLMLLSYAPYSSRYLVNTRAKGFARDQIAMKESAANPAHAASLPMANSIPVNQAPPVQQRQQRQEQAKGPGSKARSDFSETAFFYPELRTDERGQVSFEFTMPQSLTKWKFMGFSNTRDMYTGMIEAYAVTSKEFMLVPNMPRFVRVGDKSSIAADITNLSGKNITGKVTFELFDPITGKVVFSRQQAFAVNAGATAVSVFPFTVDGSYSLLACRMVANGRRFSDGEQRLLPVLSDKIQVTETKTVQVRGEETRRFSLADLFNQHSPTATNRRLTLEFSGNPAWYAIQALPALNNPVGNDAISWAAAYYANSLASYIMKSQPRIKAVFDSWKLQNGKKETLWSNLQKNPELKNILLQESPWVMQARTEAEQKERLGLLFDLNTVNGNNFAALNKLQGLQKKDGSWSWYPGMPGNRWVTQFVLESFAKLSLLTGGALPDEVQIMRKKAFSYLHRQVLDEYNHIMQGLRGGGGDTGISEMALDYLYLCALASEPIPAANRQAYAYYLKKVRETIARQAIGSKAMSAVILSKAGNSTAADGFIKSIKEYAVTTDEMGMYFPSASNAYSWGSLAIPVQTLVIQAMEMEGKNAEDIERLKMWLLKQKQTQAWSSPVATVDAVYALLNRGKDLLASQGDVRLSLGNEVLETYSPAKTSVPGLGYIQKTFTGEEIKQNMDTLSVEKRDPGVAWGAVFAQYLENMDKVKSAGGALKVEKKLYKEEMVNGKAELQPLTKDTRLQVGDKVVARLSVSADRDMDFVQLKDERAACFEPQNALSGYRREGRLNCYVSVKDASTDFFIETLPKGTYVLAHSFHVTRSGEYAGGIAALQSAYAPEFAAHSASVKVKVR